MGKPRPDAGRLVDAGPRPPAAPRRACEVVVAGGGTRPVIGICAVAEQARWSFWDEQAHLVSDSYVGAVQRAGGVALLMPVDGTQSVEPLVSLLDGVILVGGADVDPGSYGAQRSPATEATYPRRDSFEIEVVRQSMRREIPLLGICRGMQILNVALAGTLIQDLGSDPPNPHRRRLGSFEGTEQAIQLRAGSRAARAAAGIAHLGRCHHHQAIDVLGEGLVISGTAPDGVVEAIEAEGPWWALGVQWHPEVDPGSPVIAAFIAAAAAPTGTQSRADVICGPA